MFYSINENYRYANNKQTMHKNVLYVVLQFVTKYYPHLTPLIGISSLVWSKRLFPTRSQYAASTVCLNKVSLKFFLIKDMSKVSFTRVQNKLGTLSLFWLLKSGISLFYKLLKKGKIAKKIFIYREKSHYNFSGDILDCEDVLGDGVILGGGDWRRQK